MKKEKYESEIRVLIQKSLHDKLQNKCDENYRTISEVVRELIVKYIKENKS